MGRAVDAKVSRLQLWILITIVMVAVTFLGTMMFVSTLTPTTGSHQATAPTTPQSPSKTDVATPALPSGVPPEMAPTGETDPIDVGRAFAMRYPADWKSVITPDGTNDGSSGEVTLNQPPTPEFPDDGGIVTFRSLKTQAWKSLYGDDPVGHWRGQSCVNSSIEKTVGPIVYEATKDVTVQFYKNICTGSGTDEYAGPDHFADIDYIWYVPGVFVGEATHGSSNGVDSDVPVVPGPVTWMISHGVKLTS